jgi:hypothetical protein
MAKFNLVTITQNLENSSTVAEVYDALRQSGANYTHIASEILAASVVKRKGAFATSLPNVSFSFMGMHQGAAYYYIVACFIWGVEHGHYDVCQAFKLKKHMVCLICPKLRGLQTRFMRSAWEVLK